MYIVLNTHLEYSNLFWSYLVHFLIPNAENKKNPPQKKFLLYQVMELSDSNFSKIVLFSEMKRCTFQPKTEK